MSEETEVISELPKEKKRTRKKQLYTNIRNAMEFYFSPANLAKDRWLAQKLSESDSIELTHFLGFNKVRALTTDVNDIVKALRNSEVLEVSDEYKVKRKTPIQFKENADDCIIYVEQIPADADHDWLKTFFVSYGTIDYVSIPKYTNTKKCKGFAFVEFSNPEEAKKAVEEYKNAGRYLSNTIEPQDLLSISTFNNDGSDALSMEQNYLNKKRKLNNGSPEDGIKKMKMIGCDDDDLKSHVIEVPNTAYCDSDEEGNMDESRRKKNRKKKKKTKKNKITPETTGFRILSKSDWKYLRNKYLNIQREKMKQLKKHLKQQQYKSNCNKHNTEKITKTNKNDDDIVETEVSKESIVSKDYMAGVIVKIDVAEPVVDIKEFKNEVKEKCEDIKYVDIKEGSVTAFVRFSTPEGAKDFCENSVWNSAEILKDEEEISYWKKLEEDRQRKINNQNNKIKRRGKEKMLKKAEKVLGQYITFED